MTIGPMVDTAFYTNLTNKLLATCNLGAVGRIDTLSGGRNNPTFRVFTQTGASYAAKFFSDCRRENYGREKKFLIFCAHHGIKDVPVLVFYCDETRSILTNYIPGTLLSLNQINVGHIKSCANFIQQLKTASQCQPLPEPAFDASLSIETAISSIQNRYLKVSKHHKTLEMLTNSSTSQTPTLDKIWSQVTHAIDASFSAKQLKTESKSDQLIYSPSDFGCHNIILGNNGTLNFIDFEYSGADDHLKLALDFFSNPEVDMPWKLFEYFMETSKGNMRSYELSLKKISALQLLYKSKWAFISINTAQKILNSLSLANSSDEHSSPICNQIKKIENQLFDLSAKIRIFNSSN